MIAFAWAAAGSDSGPGLPLDDAWIHLAYARSIVQDGRWALWSGAEASSGTTGYLWTALLLPGVLATRAGLSPAIAALIPGMIAFVLLVFCWQRLLIRASVPSTYAVLSTLSVALSGNLLFHAVSGMETLVILFLAILTLERHQARDRLGTALAVAAASLARPEGLLLGLALAASTLLERTPSEVEESAGIRRAATILVPALAGFALLLSLNLATGGGLSPNTLQGRRWLTNVPPEPDFSPSVILRQARSLAGDWTGRFLDFGYTLGLSGFHPATDDEDGSWAGAIDSRLAGLASLLALLGIFAASSGRGPPLTPLFLYTGLLFLAYAVLLPTDGHAGRYQVIQLFWVPALPALGAAYVSGQISRRQPGAHHVDGLLKALLVLMVLGWLGNATAWWRVTRSSVNHIQEMHVSAAGWIRRNLPVDANVAAYDIGALAFFMDRQLTDFSGLTDPEGSKALHQARLLSHLRKKQATHLVLVLRRDDTLKSTLAWYGLYPRRSDPFPEPRFQLLHSIKIPRDRHYHFRWTRNARPGMEIYSIDW